MNMKLRILLDEIMDSGIRNYLDDIISEYAFEFNLNEGLIFTHDIKAALKSMNMSRFKSIRDENKFRTFVDDSVDFKKLWELTNNLGYYPTYLYGMKGKEEISNKFTEYNLKFFLERYEKIQILFEPKYDQEIESLPKYLYHITTKSKTDKIFRQGLVPKSKSKTSSHPDRVYLAYNVDDLIKISKKFTFQSQLVSGDYFVILKIDTDRIPEYFQIYGEIPYSNRKMQDPNFKGKGLYTVNSIPPNAISVEMELKD